MKRFLFFLWVLGVSVLPGGAHVLYSPLYFLASSETICLAKATSIQGSTVTFAVTEILRGKNASSMTLRASANHPFEPKTEWLLIASSQGLGNGSVGWPKGDWIPARVLRHNSMVYVQMYGLREVLTVPDKLPDGSEGLTLEHLKQLLAKQPSKS